MSIEFEDQLVELTEWKNRHYFGKYRGLVESVGESDQLGFISVKVPEVFGDELVLERARPCSPFAGDKHGFIALPEPGDGVWVEFEAGNPSLPIWTGFWWADGEIPEIDGPLVRAFITTKGHKLILDDDGNKVQAVHADGAEMTMTDSDITIKIGDSSIKMTSRRYHGAGGRFRYLAADQNHVERHYRPGEYGRSGQAHLGRCGHRQRGDENRGLKLCRDTF